MTEICAELRESEIKQDRAIQRDNKIMKFFKRKPEPQPPKVEIPPYLCNVTNEGKLCQLTFCKNGEYHSFEFVATWSVDLNKLGEMIPK